MSAIGGKADIILGHRFRSFAIGGVHALLFEGGIECVKRASDPPINLS